MQKEPCAASLTPAEPGRASASTKPAPYCGWTRAARSIACSASRADGRPTAIRSAVADVGNDAGRGL